MDLAEAFIVGIFVRTFFYGVYLLLTAHGLRWIFFEDEGWRHRPRINKLMFTVIVLVFLFTTSNLATWITWTLGIIRGTAPNGWYIVATATLENATNLMIDAMLIFRCWIVSNKSWPAIYFPLVLWLGNIGLFVTCVYKTTAKVLDLPIFEAFCSCNIAINLYATSVIIYQILRVARRHRSGGSVSDLYEICRIIIECALPYLFSTTLFLVMVAIGANSLVLPTSFALNSTINAAAFNLLVIRVGKRRADNRGDLEFKL